MTFMIKLVPSFEMKSVDYDFETLKSDAYQAILAANKGFSMHFIKFKSLEKSYALSSTFSKKDQILEIEVSPCEEYMHPYVITSKEYYDAERLARSQSH